MFKMWQISSQLQEVALWSSGSSYHNFYLTLGFVLSPFICWVVEKISVRKNKSIGLGVDGNWLCLETRLFAFNLIKTEFLHLIKSKCRKSGLYPSRPPCLAHIVFSCCTLITSLYHVDPHPPGDSSVLPASYTGNYLLNSVSIILCLIHMPLMMMIMLHMRLLAQIVIDNIT